MSTRGAIARIQGDGFKGVYHHWDSYPKGLGQTLLDLYRGHFKQDIKAMLKTLIDEHPAGWSTIVNKDFSLAAGFNNLNKGNCLTCDKPSWEHYYQNWESHGKPLTAKARQSITNGSYMALGHLYEALPSTNAQCYCHGDRHEEAQIFTDQDAAASGVEYVYAFNETKSTMAILSSYHEDGAKMIGMFGCGDPDARWRVLQLVNLGSDSIEEVTK